MDDGYVRLYRKINDNPILNKDNNAYVVFIKLLTFVDWRTGSFTTGRFMLAERCNMNPRTLYGVLKRLEKHGFCNITSNNKYSIVSICNWSEYQGERNTTRNNHATTTQQQGNTKQELIINNKELLVTEVTKVSQKPDIQAIFNFYTTSFDTPKSKLSKQRELKIKVRLNDAGDEMLRLAITNTANSAFHRGDNDRGWKADIDWIIKSYEQVEKLANMNNKANNKGSRKPTQEELNDVNW